MKKFTIEVVRVGYRSATIEVEANDIKEAEQIALSNASSHEFSDEFAYDYGIENVEKN